LVDFVSAIISQRDDVDIVFVGPDGSEPWWQDKRADWGGRVKFCGVLDRDSYHGLLDKADVYVDSFPITGGTAFPEALLKVPATGINNLIQGYTYADELRVNTVTELVAKVEGLLSGDSVIISQVEKVREKVVSFQCEAAFHSRLFRLYDMDIAGIDNPDSTYDIKYDDKVLEEDWLKTQKIRLTMRKLTGLSIAKRIKLVVLLLKGFPYYDVKEFIKAIIYVAGVSKSSFSFRPHR